MAKFSVKTVFSLFKSAISGFTDNSSLLLAAALAFNAIFSIPPLLVIIIRAAGFFLGEQAVSGELSEQISDAIGENAAEAIQGVVQNASESEEGGLAFWIGLGTLIFASTTFFATLQESLNRVWNLKPKPTNGIVKMLKVRLFSFGIVLSIALLMLVSFFVSAVIAVLSDYITKMLPEISVVFITITDLVLSIGIITVLFALIFRFLPDGIIRWRDVWVGALITATLFGIGKVLIGWFIGTSDPGSAYGAAGSIIVVLIWIYYTSAIVLFGAEFTQQYACELGQAIRPKEHAVFYKEVEVVEHPDDKASGRPPAEGRFNKKG
ncbi:YihY/virulence factor BrkB family protein [Pontibacter sp. SGAir0037]|uniref:YihY/virulence factor BrkB family protein n=1 Tax=Pontibacter sp. SGAir0037 TaxID=2571030 RepID=UPI0010CD3E90|nr:YihY/virulence factor BrkB family protein [Pontibacter sp. SGAir0037]QCR24268.1 YihY/virulence factor BrkB family protein [Pontibacter sp. SGAir0037]